MIRRALMVIVVAAIAVAAWAEPETRTLARPFAIRMSAAAAAAWTDFRSLPKPDPAGVLRIDAPAITGPARIDVLHRVNGVWVLDATCEWSPGAAVRVPATNAGILLRQRGTSDYFWAEVAAGTTGRVQLQPFKTVLVRGASSDESLLLFAEAATEPRILRETDWVPFVPREPALLCATSSRGDRCLPLSAAAAEADLDEAVRGDVRMLFAEGEGVEITVLMPGNSALRPRKAAANVVRAGQWIGVTLEESAVRWPSVVVDRNAGGAALERMDGASLPPLPEFATVPSRADVGVVIRPRVGNNKVELTDRGATLVVFPATGPSIPLATGVLSEDGTFVFPTIGSGIYAWKLLSSEAAGDVLRASVGAGAPHELVFPTGPTVTGRVVRAAGGATLELPTVKVVLKQELADGRRDDVIDAVRIVDAGENGSFRIVLAAVGEYRLLARWGAASAERHFEIKSKTDVRELGDIALRNGSSLRGSMPPCPNAEVVVALLPDHAKPMALGLDDPRRAAVDASGQFLFEGLRPGTWTIGGKCQGVFVPLAPEIVVVAQDADTVVELTAAP